MNRIEAEIALKRKERPSKNEYAKKMNI